MYDISKCYQAKDAADAVRALMEDDFISGHPGISTSTLRLAREDLLRYAASTGHEPVYVDLPDPRTDEA